MSQYPQLFEWMAAKLDVSVLTKEIDWLRNENSALRARLFKLESTEDEEDYDEDNRDWVPCGLCDTTIYWDDTPNPRCLPRCAK